MNDGEEKGDVDIPKEKEEGADDDRDKEEEGGWYEFPPVAFFFTAGVAAAFLPKGALFAGNYTDVTAVVLVVSNTVIFVIFIAFVNVIRRVGFTPAVQWMVSPGFGLNE